MKDRGEGLREVIIEFFALGALAGLGVALAGPGLSGLAIFTSLGTFAAVDGGSPRVLGGEEVTDARIVSSGISFVHIEAYPGDVVGGVESDLHRVL